MKISCPKGGFRTCSSIGGLRIFNGIAQWRRGVRFFAYAQTLHTASACHVRLVSEVRERIKITPFSKSMSESRTPRHFYGGRRDVPRRCLNSSRSPPSSFFRPSDPLPYRPNESLLENPSRLQEDVPGMEDDEVLDENEAQFYPSPLSSAPISRSPLTSSAVHNVRQPPLNQSGVMAMLQQQQALLQKVLQQQEEMKVQQSVLSQKLAKLEDEIHSSSCSSSPARVSDQ